MDASFIYCLSKKFLYFFLALVLTLTFSIYSPWAYSQTPTPDTSKGESEKIEPATVMLNDKVLFKIKTTVGSFTPEDRAKLNSQRIEEVAKDDNLSPDDIYVKNSHHNDYTTITANAKTLVTITEEDAKAVGLTRQELADEYLDIIRDSISLYRREREPLYRTLSTIGAILATLSIWLLFRIINHLFPLVKNSIHRTIDRLLAIQNVSTNHLVALELSNFLIQILRLLKLMTFIGVIYLYIPFVLTLFPLTRKAGNFLLHYLDSSTQLVLRSIVNYIPNIFIVLLIVFLTYYLIKFIQPIFQALSRRTLSLRGFYPEWAEPTYQLLKFLIIAIAIAIALPYIPGFQSPAFQGVSVFLGVLFSLGSTSAIANTVGGVILIYTRAFQIGDRIMVGEVIGDVEEKSLLVTRLRTPKNILVTIPNSTLLGVNIINYSASYRDTKIPLILNTTITLGYDIPWRKVHSALIDAALKTDHILREPSPFVLQTALNDFYVSYEINAYTNATKQLEPIYSQLHQNILDRCNEVGIEILSPHYSALRDGNQNTIPSDYLPQDYNAPGFRLESLPKKDNPLT